MRRLALIFLAVINIPEKPTQAYAGSRDLLPLILYARIYMPAVPSSDA